MANESVMQAFDRFTAHVLSLLEEMKIENDNKYATKEYALENGSKIDKILLNSEEQTIGTDKSVNIDIDEYATKSYVDINNMWVSGGLDGLYYSIDGKTWTQSNITSSNFYSIYYGNNIWVAGSNNNGLYYSTDGKTWTQSNITNISFYSVYYSNNIWVACSRDYSSGSNKGLYYSLDGKTWTQSNITSGYFNDVYYGNNIWVAGSNSNGGLYYSTDGKTWTQSKITSGYFECVYYDNIWTTGDYYSTDGKTWTQSNIPNIYSYNISYDNNILVTCTNKGLYYSLDGKTWTQSNITSGYFNDVYYGNNIWVAGGVNNGLYYSIDGKTWTRSNITSGYFECVYYDNNIWVAGAIYDDGLYYSIDGKTWTQSNITSGYFYDVYYDNNKKLNTISVNGITQPIIDGNVNINVPETIHTQSDDQIYLTGVTEDNGKNYYTKSVYINPATGELNTVVINANKVYGAVWNDYAEWFEKQNVEDEFEPGDICAWDKTGVIKANSNNLWKAIGVYSDTYGHILGGEDLENMELNLEKFVPIGLAGRVKVKVLGKVNIGDYIISSNVDGVGIVDNSANLKYVVGQALEYKNSDKIDRITILIK